MLVLFWGGRGRGICGNPESPFVESERQMIALKDLSDDKMG